MFRCVQRPEKSGSSTWKSCKRYTQPHSSTISWFFSSLNLFVRMRETSSFVIVFSLCRARGGIPQRRKEMRVKAFKQVDYKWQFSWASSFAYLFSKRIFFFLLCSLSAFPAIANCLVPIRHQATKQLVKKKSQKLAVICRESAAAQREFHKASFICCLLKLIEIQQGAFSTRAKLLFFIFISLFILNPSPMCWAFSEIFLWFKQQGFEWHSD